MTETPRITAEINLYAIRCFRDVGDHDYIAARALYRAQLGAQFLWSAQQAVEKYLKCILVLNRLSSNDIGHNLKKAFDRINANLDFTISLDKREKEIFDMLCRFGPNRYLEFSWSLHDFEIVKLDMLVWHLRQYCKPMSDMTDAGRIIPIRKASLEAIKSSKSRPARLAYIPSGKIEAILRKKDHPAHDALVWQNLRYSLKTRNKVKLHRWSQAENSPLSLRPRIIDYIIKYVHISKSGEAAYKRIRDS